MANVVTMFDTIGADAGNIPADAQKIAGYVTGSPDILWTPAGWGRFPHAGRVRVDQSPRGSAYALKIRNGKPAADADVYDMEDLAGTPERFAELAPPRHDAGLPNCGYGTPSTRRAAAARLDAVPGRPRGWWHSAFGWWLADPNLSLAEADALAGQVIDGFLTVAVQWATPTSNPSTPVGHGGTLKSLNLDLSVALAGWHPAPPPPDPWQAGALRLARQLETLATSLVTILEAHQ